jgi:tellurite methyltransferase
MACAGCSRWWRPRSAIDRHAGRPSPLPLGARGDGATITAMSLPAAWAPLVGADIYLIDQLMRGRIRAGMSVLDIGCGDGRNLPALAGAGCEVTAIDVDARAVAAARARMAGTVDPARIVVAQLEELPFAPGGFAVVLVNAVLHFAPDAATFHGWADACWRQRAGQGLLLARLSTRIGLPDAAPPGFGYLPDAADLLACEQRWKARRADPLKTTLVESIRTMTTWVLTA